MGKNLSKDLTQENQIKKLSVFCLEDEIHETKHFI